MLNFGMFATFTVRCPGPIPGNASDVLSPGRRLDGNQPIPAVIPERERNPFVSHIPIGVLPQRLRHCRYVVANRLD